jgi:uncharacterized protein YbcI
MSAQDVQTSLGHGDPLTAISSGKLGGTLGYDLGGRHVVRTLDSALSPREVQAPHRVHGDVLTEISDGMVALLKEFYGHGPSRTKSYYADDLVVCVLRGGFSRVEQTLLEGGRGAAVIDQRIAFQDLMRARFEEVIASATGRCVVGFMSGNQQHPDMMCEVFILAPTDLFDHAEIAADVGLAR